MVENVKNPNTAPIVDPTPTVLNGHTTYADAARFAAEEQVLFRESPVIAGLSGDLPAPNDYKRFEVAGKSVLLTRDSDGIFHAFENACRHRAMELVPAEAPTGNKQLHVCPYHAWAYGSDGALLSVPFEQGFTDDEGAEHATDRGGLIELPSAERAGLLFVVATKISDAHFERMMAEVMPPELQAELEIAQLDGLMRVQSQDMVIDANWKLPVDTFCESCKHTSNPQVCV
jgi:phenylpropionate dioxygenase-like ring-hydroxylating dioxygenase large terminal subunit